MIGIVNETILNYFYYSYISENIIQNDENKLVKFVYKFFFLWRPNRHMEPFLFEKMGYKYLHNNSLSMLLSIEECSLSLRFQNVVWFRIFDYT